MHAGWLRLLRCHDNTIQRQQSGPPTHPIALLLRIMRVRILQVIQPHREPSLVLLRTRIDALPRCVPSSRRTQDTGLLSGSIQKDPVHTSTFSLYSFCSQLTHPANAFLGFSCACQAITRAPPAYRLFAQCLTGRVGRVPGLVVSSACELAHLGQLQSALMVFGRLQLMPLNTASTCSSHEGEQDEPPDARSHRAYQSALPYSNRW